jgi:hypothetical protein
MIRITEDPYHGPINGIISALGRVADEDINLFLVGGKNYSWQLHEGHDGEIDGLGSKIGPKPQPGYQLKAHIKGFRLTATATCSQ